MGGVIRSRVATQLNPCVLVRSGEKSHRIECPGSTFCQTLNGLKKRHTCGAMRPLQWLVLLID
jgi:hypothetical protein